MLGGSSGAEAAVDEAAWRGTSFGRFVRPAVLVAMVAAAVAVIGLAWWSGRNASADTGATGQTRSLETPLLSARRIPRTLLQRAGELRLDDQLQAITDNAPASSCLALQPGGTGRALHRGDAGGVVPASLVKLLVTHAALDVFGPAHRFTTSVRVEGDPATGTVGNLYLVGGGDPYLSTSRWTNRDNDPVKLDAQTSLEALADQVVDAGLTTIDGSVVGDSSYFQTSIEEVGPYRSPGPAPALIVNEGFLDWPDDPTAPIHQADPTVRSTRHGAEVFTRLLVERGVTISGSPATGTSPETTVEIAAIESATIEALVTTINTFSSSLGAKMLLRQLGLELRGAGSDEAGIDALVAHLGESGYPMDDVRLVDGMGLSEENRVTCELILEVLTSAGPESILARSLATTGERGTAGERFTNSELRGLVRAKTGTLRSSRALAGFARSWVDGRETPFVIIMNESGLSYDEFDPWARSLQEDLLLALVQFPCVPDHGAIDQLLPSTSPVIDLDDPGDRQGDELPNQDSRSAALDAALDSIGTAVDQQEIDRWNTDPGQAGCDDAQRIHDLEIASYLIEVRYSPTCATMWARATFSVVESGAARLHLVGYSCLQAETECRAVAQSILLTSSEPCIDEIDESGTCLLGSNDQVWTHMLPASLVNLRACVSLRPGPTGDDPSALDLDGCTPPAFELLPTAQGPVRSLARTRSACRLPQPVGPLGVSDS